MKKKIAVFIIFFIGLSIASQARPSPIDNKHDIALDNATFRNFVIDCLERSDATSCHKAGIYILNYRQNQKKAIIYFKKACELGRGPSCKYLGDMYAKYYKKTSQEYYEKGCLRKSKSACRLAKH